MHGNLRARLSQIRSARPARSAAPAATALPGWERPDPLVLRRRRRLAVPGDWPSGIAPDLGLLFAGADVPDFRDQDVRTGDLLFFDLETTGLSGGAGTVAFLAAFGRLAADPAGAGTIIDVDQYLLADYPGEGAFIDLVLAELAAVGPGPVLVTYNGKSFDAQILRTRCAMNRRRPPALPHLDLLHPTRSLWGGRLPSCSLTEVERSLLGIQRDDDLPGSRAPEAWFSFLRDGATSDLERIAEHNLLDLRGLAALYLVLDRVAAAPREAAARYGVDPEALALRWRRGLRRRGELRPGGGAGYEETFLFLLEAAAAAGYGRAAYLLAVDRFRAGRPAEGRALLRAVADGEVAAGGGSDKRRDRVRALACRALAIDAERRRRAPAEALEWTERALAFTGTAPQLQAELEARRDRLRRS